MDTSDLNAADFAAILQKPVDANGLIDAVFLRRNQSGNSYGVTK